MQYLLIFMVVLFSVSARKEDFAELEELMNNPRLLAELEKRFGTLLSDEVPEKEPEATTISCTALTGTLNTHSSNCDFRTDVNKIIKATESLNGNAEFVGKVDNITCAIDCTQKCCNDSDCDTAVYQNKDEHKCYLFKCGIPSKCVFTDHADYRVVSVSELGHKSHSYTHGGSPVSHENDLENLGSHSTELESQTKRRTTTTEAPTVVTTSKLAVGEYCVSYGTKCADPHASCYNRECTCRAGYHPKYGVCRKHCQDDEFECDNEGYGPEVEQCVPSSYRCDGNDDCVDGSDEYKCPKIDKGYKGVQDANMYQKQLFQYPYNNLYGYQAPVPNNQVPVAVAPAPNQIYQGQVPANGIQGGQYYIPGFANQNQGLNIPQTGSQVNNAWPFMDKSRMGQAQAAYQNSVPYQNGKQQNFVSNQGAYVPLLQNPGNQGQQGPVQVQPVVAQGANQNTANKNIVNNDPVAGLGRVSGIDQNIEPTSIPTETRTMVDSGDNIVGNGGSYMHAQEKGKDQQLMNHPVSNQPEKQYHVLGSDDTSFLDENDYNAGRGSDAGGVLEPNYDVYDNNKAENSETNSKVMESNKANKPEIEGIDDEYNKERFRPPVESHRHSAEEVDDRARTFPPATKSKSQIEKPTQSTVAGQKSGHSSTYASERIEDFPIWMQYENNSPNINAKKGKHFDTEVVPKESEMKSQQKTRTDSDSSTDTRPSGAKMDKNTVINEETDSFERNDERGYKYNRYDTDDADRNYNRYDPDNARRFPTNNRDRRPGYDSDMYRDRYRDRYHRPNQDSRYPYYDNTGYRGRDRFHYPVWDPFRDEYYYPDGSEHRKGGSSHGLDYEEDYRTDKHPGYLPAVKDTDYKDTEKIDTTDHADKTPVVAQPPKHTQDVQPDKSDTASKSVPLPDENTKNDNNMAPEPQPVPTVNVSSTSTPQPRKDSSEENSDTENQQPDDISDNNNTSDSKDTEDTADKNQFTYFRSENTERVESYTDSSQGPIVALALGLAITLILLIFVGCRLRNVKRRLRKGRALHSNEADYLINGMYL